MRLPSGCFGNRLINCVFTDKDKKLPAFFRVHKNLIYTTGNIKFDARAVHIPEISQGKICRPFIACVMAMEAGWTDWEKTEEYFVKGKFFKYRQQISLGNRNVHHLFFPGDTFASHVDGSNLCVSVHILGLQNLQIILPYTRAWNSVADIVTGVKAGSICVFYFQKTGNTCNLAGSAGKQHCKAVCQVITDRLIYM